MKTTHLKNMLASAALLVALAGPSVDAQYTDDELPHFAFLSGEVRTEIKGAPRTIAGSKGKKMIFEESRDTAPFAAQLTYQFIPVVALSDDYVEISEISLGFNSIATNLREAKLRSDMQAIQDAAQVQIANLESEANAMESGGDSDGAILKSMEAEEVSNDVQQMVEQGLGMIDDGMLEKEGAFDIFYANFDVLPHQDVENAYAALVMTYDETDAVLKRQGIRKSIVRTSHLGDLEADRPMKVRVSKTFVEQVVTGAEIEVYIFSGDGKPIATNKSTGLKQLTPEQLRKWRDLESKNNLQG